MRNLLIKLLTPALLFTATALAAEPEKPSPPAQKGSFLAALEEKLPMLKMQLGKLQERLGNNHPEVQSLLKEIEFVERQIKEARIADVKPKPPGKDKEAPKKSKLEEMLETALKNNPDIRVADAKAREADAEVNRTRLAVTQKVVQLYNGIEASRANVQVAEKQLERMRGLQKTGVVDQQTTDETEAKLVQAKAELSKLEAEVPYMLGQENLKGAGDEMAVIKGLKWLAGNNKAAQDAAIRLAAANLAKEEADVKRWQAELSRAKKLSTQGVFDQQTLDEIVNQTRAAEAARDAAKAQYDLARASSYLKMDSPRTLIGTFVDGEYVLREIPSPKVDAAAISGPMSDKIRAALDTPISADFEGNVPLREVLMFLRKKNPDLLINNKGASEDKAVSHAKFKDMPLGGVLQWLEDEWPEYRIVVREYGLLIAQRDHLPPDAIMLHDFWKAKPKEEKK